MPLSPDDNLSTPANYASPNQIAASREYAKYLMQGGGQQPVHHWAQGLSNMVGALIGGNKLYQSGQQEKENTFGAGQELAATPIPGQPQGPMADTAPSSAPTGGAPASIRNNNPGGQWPGPVASQFGATGSQTIGGGNKIATFPDPVSGAAAEFALLDKRYTGMPLGTAISKWSGGNSSGAYAQNIAQKTGLTPDTVITPQLLRSPQGIALGKAMAEWEAGGKSPLNDQQWQQAHQKAFGGQTADASGSIGGTGASPIGSPQAMAGALSGGQQTAASGGAMPGGPPLASSGSAILGPEYANQRQHIPQAQMGRILGNQWIDPSISKSLYGQYLEQYQPTELKTTGGRIVFPYGGGKGAEIYDLQKGELDAGGIKVPYIGTVQQGPGGLQYKGVQGMPGVGNTPQAPPPDFSGLPDMHGQPEAPPQAPPGGPDLTKPPDMHGTGPRSSLEPPPTAAGAASPMGQMAEAGAAQPQAGAAPGVKTVSLGNGSVQSDAPPIGGMLGSPPPQMTSQPEPAGPQVAQAPGGLPSMENLRDFKLNMDKQGELNKEDVKKYTENSNALMQAGTQAQQGLPMLKLAQQAVKDPKYYSGFGANAILNWKQLKAAVGDDPNAAAAMEVFEKSMAGDVLGQLRSKLQGLGQVRLAEIDLLTRSTANKFNTPAANAAVLNIIERGYNQMAAISQITDAYSGGARLDAKGNWIKGNDQPSNAGLNEVVRKYLSLHPTFSQQEIKDFNKTLDLEDKKPDQVTYTNSKAGQPVQPGQQAAPAQEPDHLQMLLDERNRRQGK